MDNSEKNLVTSELRYRRLFESSQDGILLIDPRSGKILETNPFLIDLLEYKQEDLLKKHLWEIGAFKDIAASKENFEILVKKKYVRFENLPLKTKTGKIIAVEFVSSVFEIGGESLIRCNIRDITDRVMAEEYTKAIVDTIKEPILVLNENLQIFAANEAFYQFFKSQEKDTIGKMVFDLGNRQWNSPKLKQLLQEILPEKHQIVGFEVTHKFEDIGIKTMLLNAKEIPITHSKSKAILLAIEDITEHHPSNGMLSSFETRYRKLFESAIDGSLIVDAETGTIIDANQMIIDLLGYSYKQLLAKKLWEIGLFKDISANKAQFVKMQKKGDIANQNKTLETSKGKKINTEFFMKSFTVDNQKIIQCVIRDVTEREIIKSKLEESENRFRKIFEKGNYGIVLTDQNFYFIKVNPSFCQMLGYTEKEMLTKKFTDITHPDDLKNDIIKVKQLSENKIPIYQTEKRYVRKNGEIIWGNVSVSIIQDQNISFLYYLAMIEDITIRKQAQLSLQKNESYLRATLESTNDGILAIDDKGKILHANNRFVEFWKIPKRLIQKNDDNAMLKFVLNQLIDPKGFLTKVRALYRSEKTSFDTINFKDGRIFERFSTPLMLNEKIGGRVWSFRDVTEKEKIKAELVAGKSKDDAILASIGDAVFSCNEKGVIELFNPMAENMTGIPAKSAIGKHYNDTITFIKEKTGKPSNDFVEEAIKNEKITKMVNHTLLVRHDGKQIPVADSAAPIINNQNKTIGCVVVFHDVTKERQIDKAKTEFVSIASHQLRTPLTAINWYSEMLLSEDFGKLSPKQQEYSKELYHASQRMGGLINALLNVARLELGSFSVEPEFVNVEKIVKNCLQELSPQISQKKIVINEKYDEDSSNIKADAKLLSIIFQNLISNAIKYSHDNSSVKLSSYIKDNNLMITIEDEGVGIPKNEQEKIFTKLFRASNAIKIDPDGTGLGLYIINEIIENFQGKIWFKSQEGKGTIFNVSLPILGMIKKIGSRQLIA
jgi:PAS domain S-box-containing protein